MFRKDNPREVRGYDAIDVNKNHTHDTLIEKILKYIQETSRWLLLGNGPRSQGWELLCHFIFLSVVGLFFMTVLFLFLKKPS